MALDPTESYATVAEADAYAVKWDWTDWAALLTAKKEAALREATLYINTQWVWDGYRHAYGAVLTSPWPYTMVYAAGAYIDVMPADVKTAAIHLARFAAKSPLIGGEDAGKRSYKRVKVGPIEKELDDVDASELRNSRLAFANSLLRAAGGRPIGGGGYNIPLRRVL